MQRTPSSFNLLTRRFVGTTLALGLMAAPLPSLASAPESGAEGGAAAAEAAPAEAAQAGGNVAVLTFTGDDYKASDFRTRVQTGLSEQGYTANLIRRSIDEAAAKNKCKSLSDSCLEKIGAYLNKNSKTAYDYFTWAEVPASGLATVTIYDIASKKKVVALSIRTSANDYILAEVIGALVARRLVETQVAPLPITEDEKAYLSTLDEPAETPEEKAKRQAAVDEAIATAGSDFNANLDVGAQSVDLKEDFDELCRKGPRQDEEEEGDDGETTKIRDLSPACKRGPVVGYWQPRSWAALTLALGSAVTMGVMYGLAASARGEWNTAKTALDDSGLSATDPTNACDGDVCYEDLAGAVSDATAKVRRRAIVGDVFLGATVLLGGVLAVIIYQDREAARGFLQRKKELDVLSTLRVAPMIGETNGAAMGFQF